LSIYFVSKVCQRIDTDPEFLALLKRDPDTALVGFRLDSEERRALLEGDIETLYRRGLNPLLMQRLARLRVGGLDMASYRRRMIALNTPAAGPPAADPIQGRHAT
jgi:hypothetical protein